MDRVRDKEECVCISVSLRRHLCVNEFVSVCLANVTSQIHLVHPSEIKAPASIPLRLQPNGT